MEVLNNLDILEEKRDELVAKRKRTMNIVIKLSKINSEYLPLAITKYIDYSNLINGVDAEINNYYENLRPLKKIISKNLLPVMNKPSQIILSLKNKSQKWVWNGNTCTYDAVLLNLLLYPNPFVTALFNVKTTPGSLLEILTNKIKNIFNILHSTQSFEIIRVDRDIINNMGKLCESNKKEWIYMYPDQINNLDFNANCADFTMGAPNDAISVYQVLAYIYGIASFEYKVDFNNHLGPQTPLNLVDKNLFVPNNNPRYMDNVIDKTYYSKIIKVNFLYDDKDNIKKPIHLFRYLDHYEFNKLPEWLIFTNDHNFNSIVINFELLIKEVQYVFVSATLTIGGHHVSVVSDEEGKFYYIDQMDSIKPIIEYPYNDENNVNNFEIGNKSLKKNWRILFYYKK